MCWEPALKGGSCGAGQVMGDTWAQPQEGRASIGLQRACGVASSIINGKKILRFNHFFCFSRVLCCWQKLLRLQTRLVVLKHVFCAGAGVVLLGLAEVTALFSGLC